MFHIRYEILVNETFWKRHVEWISFKNTAGEEFFISLFDWEMILAFWEKYLPLCSLESKTLLKSTCYTTDFHNCHRTSMLITIGTVFKIPNEAKKKHVWQYFNKKCNRCFEKWKKMFVQDFFSFILQNFVKFHFLIC